VISAIQLDGISVRIASGPAPVAADGAPATIDDVEGPISVGPGQAATFNVAFDTRAVVGSPDLIIAVVEQGSPLDGFFIVPLGRPAGLVTLNVQFATAFDADVAVTFATRLGDVVGQPTLQNVSPD
jgi:hypothetical protein